MSLYHLEPVWAMQLHGSFEWWSCSNLPSTELWFAQHKVHVIKPANWALTLRIKLIFPSLYSCRLILAHSGDRCSISGHVFRYITSISPALMSMWCITSTLILPLCARVPMTPLLSPSDDTYAIRTESWDAPLYISMAIVPSTFSGFVSTRGFCDVVKLTASSYWLTTISW